MPKFYIKWQLNPLAMPANPEERVKIWLSLLEMSKADIKTGKVKDWGICADGSCGYAIREEASEADAFAAMLKWMPYVNFDAKPVLTADQTIEAIKKIAAAAK